MLRRNPTRIEVKLDDLEEFNQMKKDKDHLLISTFHSKMYFPLQQGVQSGPLSWKVQ
jgi:hypothetical protein